MKESKNNMVTIVAKQTGIKLRLIKVDTHSDGTLWYHAMPLLSCEGAPSGMRDCLADLSSTGKWSEIDTEYWLKPGYNRDGMVWVGTLTEWNNHPWKALSEQANKSEMGTRKEMKAKCATIYLSSRGGGDYDPVAWHGDITASDTSILSECRKSIDWHRDVDVNLTDDQIIGKITRERKRYSDALKSRNAIEEVDAGIFALAKQTGKRQKLASWVTPECTSNMEDCSFDTGVKWAYPDGHGETHFVHCH